MTVGSNIRKLRKLNKLTQIEFAQRIGISQGNLSEIEQGNTNPSLDTLLAIKNEFKCSIDEILATDTNNSMTDEEIGLISAFRKLKSRDKIEITEYIKLKIKLNQELDE